MLQLQTKTIDICRITKLLVKYNIKASITDSVITLEGDVSDELLTQLCGSIDINAVQNFISQEPLYVLEEASFIKSEESTPRKNVEILQEDEIPQHTTTSSYNTSEYDLIFSEVKRGEIYWCDFANYCGSIQGGYRPAIVIQNDVGNLHSSTTIVIPCTTEHKKWLPVHYHAIFSSKNIIDYDSARVPSAENTILAEQIQTVDKAMLRKYIGTLTPEFMTMLQDKIDISLHLSREAKTTENSVATAKKAKVDAVAPKERQDVNIVQIQLLSFVDINELLKISQSSSTDEIKAKKILELFGFDFKRNGVEYLLKAIISSPKNDYFNLETLSESISRDESVDKEEIKRLIVARVKETFGFRKAPTIDFIRLINSFLVKREVENEETNI